MNMIIKVFFPYKDNIRIPDELVLEDNSNFYSFFKRDIEDLSVSHEGDVDLIEYYESSFIRDGLVTKDDLDWKFSQGNIPRINKNEKRANNEEIDRVCQDVLLNFRDSKLRMDKSSLYESQNIDYIFPFTRVDKDVIRPLLDILRVKIGQFHGAMGRYMDIKNHSELMTNYLVSQKMDGLRGWLYVYLNNVYLQLRDNRFFLIGPTSFSSKVICDCEVMMMGDDIEIMMFDCILFDKSLANQHFIGRYSKLREVKINITGLMFTVQSYFPVDLIKNKDYGEGLVFTRIDCSYTYGVSNNIIFLKNSNPSLDLKYMKGGLYSAHYKKDRSLEKYVLEGKVPWSCVEGVIVEVSLGREGFRKIRYRYDKKMPNSAFTVRDLLSRGKVMSVPDLYQLTRKMKTFYTKDSVYTMYKREGECVRCYFKEKKLFFYRSDRLSLVNLFAINMLQWSKDNQRWVKDIEEKHSSLIYYLFHQEKRMLTRYKTCKVHNMALCCVEYYHKDGKVDSMSRCVFEHNSYEDVVLSIHYEIEKNYEMKIVNGEVVVTRVINDNVDEVVIDY